MGNKRFENVRSGIRINWSFHRHGLDRHLSLWILHDLNVDGLVVHVDVTLDLRSLSHRLRRLECCLVGLSMWMHVYWHSREIASLWLLRIVELLW